MMWIAFFSQTGSEIVNLASQLNTVPNLIVTNNVEDKIKFHPGIRKINSTIMSGQHDIIMNYFKSCSIYDLKNTIITLHGYLRILPPEVCERFKIYNGHPGAIHLYPELKGKDPQERVWNEKEKYPIIGSVVHKCTPELDGGEIVTSIVTNNTCNSKEEVYDTLKMTSMQAWLKFFDENL